MSGTFRAHSGHSFGAQMPLLIRARVSSGTSFSSASLSAASPTTARAPITTALAPHARRSSSVPRTAEPAPMTSLTTATRRPFSFDRSGLGMRYFARKSRSPAGASEGAECVNGRTSSSATMRADEGALDQRAADGVDLVPGQPGAQPDGHLLGRRRR